MSALSEIVEYTDGYLRIREIGDWENALNGLQIENSAKVTKIGAAVDVSTQVLTEAAKRGVDVLIVHHGLFWPGLQTVTGALNRQLRIAFENDIALYSAHLPLDIHPEVGNNAQLAAALGLNPTEPFFEEKGSLIGVKAKARGPRDQLFVEIAGLVRRRAQALSSWTGERGEHRYHHGRRGGEIYRVAAQGIDTFITGEVPHWAAIAAQELGLNLLLGGHYATETFGVKALAAHLSKKFDVPFEFIDFPTGL